MNSFLKNLRDSVDTGRVNQGAIDKLTEINEINKLVVEKYGEEKAGNKMSKRDLSKLERKVDDLVGERKEGIEQDLFDALEALGENILVKEEIKIDDVIVKDKEIDDIEFNAENLTNANNLLSKICLFELEYTDFLENSVFYKSDILTIKNDLIKILKKK